MEILRPREDTSVYIMPFLNTNQMCDNMSGYYFYKDKRYYYVNGCNEIDKHISEILRDSYWQNIKKRDIFSIVTRYNFCVIHENKIKIMQVGRKLHSIITESLNKLISLEQYNYNDFKLLKLNIRVTDKHNFMSFDDSFIQKDLNCNILKFDIPIKSYKEYLSEIQKSLINEYEEYTKKMSFKHNLDEFFENNSDVIGTNQRELITYFRLKKINRLKEAIKEKTKNA